MKACADFLKGLSLPALSLVAALATTPASAAVELRVEARPVSSPIETYATVTDAGGGPVAGLTAADFTLRVDGQLVTIGASNFSLPPVQDPNQRVSVVFLMDYSPSTEGTPRATMEDAVVAFINQMAVGDYAAIVKFNGTNAAGPYSVIQPFTRIDAGAGTSALVGAATTPYDGRETRLFDSIDASLLLFESSAAMLPNGPKALIVISDGDDDRSLVKTQADVQATANRLGIPLFTIDLATVAAGTQTMQALAAQTGGRYTAAPTDSAISSSYAAISNLLNNEYLLTFTSTISDCGSHTVQIEVAGQAAPASNTFTRCDAQKPTTSGGGGGGGGGGSFGLFELLAGLVLVGAMRRRPA
jgi:VWFA-related protein